MYKMRMHLLALTIFGALTVNGLRVFQEIWKNKCKNVGIEYDSEEDYRRFLEYTNCGITSINATQFAEDANAMIEKFRSAELDISTIKPTLQKYCPQAKAFLNCEKKLSTECFTEEEHLRWTVHGSIKKSFTDFFCDNDGSGMTEFINGNGIECGMAKERELTLCFEKYYDDLSSAAMLSAAMNDTFILFAVLPKADVLCDSLETVGNCIKQLFQQCNLSEVPAKQIADLLSYIQTETKCATVPKIDRELEKLNPIWTVVQRDIARLKSLETSSNTN